mmetsp:Transcript_5044/g.3701  ORF Transcript_5044/g.3701 Transcript_5044/m.3701 type:complete len:155 (-) Transcript_5044:1118-1582(-)
MHDLVLVMHNPSLLPQRIPAITTYLPNFMVSKWNATLSDFVPLFSESYCYHNVTEEKECDLHVEGVLAPREVAYFRVQRVVEKYYVHEVKSKWVFTNDSYIENDLLKLRFMHKSDSGEVHFRITEKDMAGAEEDFIFDFRQYLSSKKGKQSGMY